MPGKLKHCFIIHFNLIILCEHRNKKTYAKNHPSSLV